MSAQFCDRGPILLLRYAATQILRSAVGELTIDYLRGAPQPAQLVLCSGFLDKRSPKKLMGVSAWQTRWFELTPTALTYWEPMEAGIEAAKRKEGDLDSLKKPVYRGNKPRHCPPVAALRCRV